MAILRICRKCRRGVKEVCSKCHRCDDCCKHKREMEEYTGGYFSDPKYDWQAEAMERLRRMS